MSKNDTNAPESGAQSTPSAVAPSGSDAETTDLAMAGRKSVGKAVWTGAAVGIGSAAIVAALLYSRKKP
ncbi:hypothetical protein [Sphingobium sp.]|uniref:hypothetical protein n=1 Tax=Sphingobium sp. TaxID=1912891 RepID=UPI003BB66A8B